MNEFVLQEVNGRLDLIKSLMTRKSKCDYTINNLGKHETITIGQCAINVEKKVAEDILLKEQERLNKELLKREESFKEFVGVSIDLITDIFKKNKGTNFRAETSSTNGGKFSDVDLEDIAWQAQKMFITDNSRKDKIVGRVEAAKIIGKKVVITGFLRHNLSGKYIVPYGAVERDGQDDIESFILHGFECVKDHSDESITPLKYLPKQ